MDYHTVVLEFLLLWISSLTREIFVNTSDVLRCYDCLDTFGAKWTPYTDCQMNVTAVPIATCLTTDRYCKVERVSVKGTGATISILRSCAGDCFYGCRIFGYGVSRLSCTSCCNTTLCNTGSGAGSVSRNFPLPWRGKLVCVSVAVVMVMLVTGAC